jgi:hypothetical protein
VPPDGLLGQSQRCPRIRYANSTDGAT